MCSKLKKEGLPGRFAENCSYMCVFLLGVDFCQKLLLREEILLLFIFRRRINKGAHLPIQKLFASVISSMHLCKLHVPKNFESFEPKL